MGPKYNRVAVIGGGISGVVSALHLKAEGIEVVLYERSKSVGGVWIYDPRPPPEPSFPTTSPLGDILADDSGKNTPDAVILEVSPEEKESIRLRHAPPSPCYEGLTNNVSTPLMQIKNQEWPAGTADFVKHDILGAYVQKVPVRGSLQDSIRLNTRVSKVWKNGKVWFVESTELQELSDGKLKKLRTVDEFDAIVVANGHYHVPNIPDIPGLKEWKEKFPDRIQHSKGYRTPSNFAGQNVLLIGAGTSSMDIAKELGPVANSIIQLTRGGKLDLPVDWLPANGRRVVGTIDLFTISEEALATGSSAIPGTVVLTDGTVLKDIHRVILGTGYHMSYPFLQDLHDVDKRPQDVDDDEHILITNGTQTHNLHRDIWYIPDPSLAFIGIPYYTTTFSLFEIQAIAMSKVFAGKAELPPRATMREEYLQRLGAKGYGRDFHNLMGPPEIEYAAALIEWINKDGAKLGYSPVEGHTAQWHEARKELIAKRADVTRFRGGQAVEV